MAFKLVHAVDRMLAHIPLIISLQRDPRRIHLVLGPIFKDRFSMWLTRLRTEMSMAHPTQTCHPTLFQGVTKSVSTYPPLQLTRAYAVQPST